MLFKCYLFCFCFDKPLRSVIQNVVEARGYVKQMDVACVGGDGLGPMQHTSCQVLTRIEYWWEKTPGRRTMTFWTKSTSTSPAFGKVPFWLMAVSALVASYTISLFRDITAKLATSAGENRIVITLGIPSPTLFRIVCGFFNVPQGTYEHRRCLCNRAYLL